MADSNYLADLVRKGATAVGGALLGKGKANDMTSGGQEYRLYKREQEAQGLPVVTPEQFALGVR